MDADPWLITIGFMIFQKMFYFIFYKILTFQTVPNCHITLLLIDQKETSINTALENSTN